MRRPSIKFTPSHPSAPWRVYYRGKDYWRKTKNDAQAKADELLGGKGLSKHFSDRELDDVLQAKLILGGVPVLEAARAFAAQNVTTITIDDAMARHFKEETIGRRPAYLKAKKYNLDILLAAFKGRMVGTITQGELLNLRSTFSTGNVMNSFMSHARVFFHWCERLKMIRRDYEPTHGITDIDVKRSKVILTLGDVDILLSVCRKRFPRILSAVAFQIFHGIRTAEICRLEWSAVRIGKLVDISEEVSKTRERRVIDWWPKRLSEFITPRYGFKGKIVNRARGKSDDDVTDVYEKQKTKLIKACKKAKRGFKWGQNAMRHTASSYAVAYWQSAAKAALHFGHKEQILFKNYRDYRTQEEAYLYYGETPPAEVIQLTQRSSLTA